MPVYGPCTRCGNSNHTFRLTIIIYSSGYQFYEGGSIFGSGIYTSEAQVMGSAGEARAFATELRSGSRMVNAVFVRSSKARSFAKRVANVVDRFVETYEIGESVDTNYNIN